KLLSVAGLLTIVSIASVHSSSTTLERDTMSRSHACSSSKNTPANHRHTGRESRFFDQMRPVDLDAATIAMMATAPTVEELEHVKKALDPWPQRQAFQELVKAGCEEDALRTLLAKLFRSTKKVVWSEEDLRAASLLLTKTSHRLGALAKWDQARFLYVN